ncbi:MAG TPA: DUF4012 domain-containing protein [Patescibacteria group bacterium]|nr:DUF4012 domain-containing protein [Patescibacteria group bacterium]
MNRFHKKLDDREILNNSEFLIMPKIPAAETPKLGKRPGKWNLIRFAATLLVFTLLLQAAEYLSSAQHAQGEILGAATSAYDDLSGAQASLTSQDFNGAKNQFSQALDNLQSAQSKLDGFKALELVAPQAKGAAHVLAGAQYLAQAGAKLTDALGIFDKLNVSSSGVADANFSQVLLQNRDLVSSSLNLLTQAGAEFDQASGLPSDYSATLQAARDQISVLTGLLQNLSDLEDIYLGFFGNGPKVYLLAFQNYDEVRATGGFIGTYGVLKINSGQIQDLKIDSIYDLDGHIYSNTAAPGPFQPAIQKWGIRDANWFADFPTSARKLLEFFEAGSQTADGVVAVTPAIFEDLLKVTGPINMPSYGVTITADNFQQVVQFKTSVDYDRTLNQPKQMLADFAPMLLDRLSNLSRDQWLALLQDMEQNLIQKQILLYSTDPNLEQKITDLKVAGNIEQTDFDYFNVVNTNLGGTKTDLSVKQTVSLSAKVLSDGSVMDTVKIDRANTSSQVNKDYLRVLVPDGATLISSTGFDPGDFNSSQAQGLQTDPELAAWDKGTLSGQTFIRTESGKTEFAGWLNLESGADKAITLVYMLPKKLNISFLHPSDSYSLLFQKQDGVLPYDFSASLDVGNFSPKWETADAAADSRKINFKYTTGSDQYWGIAVSK